MDCEEREELIKTGESYCDQATGYVGQADFQNALECYDKAQKVFEKISDLPWLVFLFHEKFHLYHRMEQYDQALQLSDTIVKYYRKTDNIKGLCLFMTHLASLHLDQENINQSLESLRIAEVINREKNLVEMKGYIFSNIAANLFNLESYSEAITYLNRAAASYDEKSNRGEWLWCQLYLGKSYHKIYYFQEAEKKYYKAFHGYMAAKDYPSALLAMEPLRDLYKVAGKTDKLDALDLQIEKTKGMI